MSTPAAEPPVTDSDFPTLWSNYAALLENRQRMLQSAMAFHVTATDAVKALYECESKSGVPHIEYVPQTQQGKNALTKFNQVADTYAKVLSRFKELFEL